MERAQDVGEFVMSLIASACNLPRAEIALDTNLQELGIDSLMIPAIVAQVEADYRCELTHEQALGFLQAAIVSDMVVLVRSLVQDDLKPAAAAS